MYFCHELEGKNAYEGHQRLQLLRPADLEFMQTVTQSNSVKCRIENAHPWASSTLKHLKAATAVLSYV